MSGLRLFRLFQAACHQAQRQAQCRHERAEEKVLQQRRGPSAPLSGRLAIAVTLFPPDRRRYDLDNRLKAVLDSLTEARVWEDDRHVKIIHLEEGGIVEGGACRVCIAPAPDQVALLDAYGQGGE